MNNKNLNRIKKFFYTNGFVVVRNIITKNKIGLLNKEIEKVKKKSIKLRNPHLHYTQDGKINTIHNINKYLKSGNIVKLSENKKIKKIVNYVLGKTTKVRNIEFFLKPKKTGLKSPFHQDNYYWNFINGQKALNLWLACSKSNYKNGGVCYLKKSHKIGLLNHELSYAAGSSQKIVDEDLRKINLKKIYPKLNPGDFIIHHSEVIHGSSKNISNQDRMGIVISYKTKDAKIDKKKIVNYKLRVVKNLKYLKKSKLH